MLKITEINGTDQFYGLKYKWNEVLERSKDKNPYLTWEYLLTYWRHFGKEKKLRILYIENENKIIAIAPLRQSRYKFAHLLGYDVIEPLAYRHSDYTGLILSEKEAECLKLFLNRLVEHDDWDFIYLYDIPGTSIIPHLLPRISEPIPKFELEEGVICPYITIPDSMDILMRGLSAKFRKNLRRSIKNLQKDYGKVELKRYDEFSSVEEAMNLFFELHQKRWKSKGKLGVYSSQKIRDFSLDVSKVFANNEWLALYFLTVNEEPIASQYCLEYKQKMHYGLGGFDPDYSKYSVGNLITAKVIEKCIERKIKEYDFLKGDEPYKFDWTRTYRRNLNVRIVNRKVTSNLFHRTIRTVKQTKVDKILGKFLDF